jgi:membrane-associated protease RseP (regulator of RpoE activity)
MVGARLAENFHLNRPAYEIEADFRFVIEVWRQPSLLFQGLPFSLTLLTILLAHEFGHYLTCAYYRLDASLPYFLPAPTIIGTLGAFIRIRSPIYSRKALFDVGVSGPLAGFVFLLPALAIGLAFSKVIPGIAERGDLIFGTPPVVWLLSQAVFPGTPASDIYLHPVARAAWIGVFATALNLLPIGQLDGGHILYAFTGPKHRMLSRLFAIALVPIGIFYWYVWVLWAVFFFFFGSRRPPIQDDRPLDATRVLLGALALVVLVLTFTPAPVRPGA